MSTNSKLFLSLNFIFLLILFSLLFDQQKAWERKQILGISKTFATRTVGASASIGAFHFTLDGYTSPGALVTIQGMGIYDQTFANRGGYFQFSNSFSPFSPREACLTAQDQMGRLTNPVCLPPFSTNRDITIGPVILPPTVSLNNPPAGGVYYVGDEAILSGQSIPNSQITLSTYTKNRSSRIITQIVKPIYADTIPQLIIKTDIKGNYAVVLPSASDESLRLFTQTKYNEQPSAQSIALNLKIWPVWMIVISFFKLIFLLLKPRLLELIIVAQLTGLVIYLLKHFLHPHVLYRQRILMVRPVFPLMVE